MCLCGTHTIGHLESLPSWLVGKKSPTGRSGWAFSCSILQYKNDKNDLTGSQLLSGGRMTWQKGRSLGELPRGKSSYGSIKAPATIKVCTIRIIGSPIN